MRNNLVGQFPYTAMRGRTHLDHRSTEIEHQNHLFIVAACDSLYELFDLREEVTQHRNKQIVSIELLWPLPRA